MKIEKIIMTPDQATKLMEANVNNRPKKDWRTKRYVNLMRTGMFRVNGDSIRVSKSGRLLDGQHRLEACIITGVSFETILVTDLDDDVFDTIDRGGRERSDILACAGVTNAHDTGSILTAIDGFAKARISDFSSGRGYSPEVMDLYKQYPDTHEALRLGKYCASKLKTKPTLIGGALYWGLLLDRAKTIEFAEKLASGEGLFAGSPILALRNRIITQADSKAKLTRPEMAALIAKALTHHLQGKKLGTLKWVSGVEAFPRITN